MFEISYPKIALGVLLLASLGCSTGDYLATLTPTPGKVTIPTMTASPTVIYPTLTPSGTPVPTPDPFMLCEETPVDIICLATVCVVRKAPASGEENKGYLVPNQVVITNVLRCECQACAEFERDWFYLGESGGQDYWALDMPRVWEVTNQGEQ